MKAQGTMKELRKDLTDFVENYIDSMDIDEPARSLERLLQAK